MVFVFVFVHLRTYLVGRPTHLSVAALAPGEALKPQDLRCQFYITGLG